ncbi:membrane protein [Burkholderia phage BcepSauron]|uniref:Membrane protein n=1 Tax=Burkholderia phage BcepSauron TaxID=2530033 RepID=A0A482MLV7_9CAUD|nr:membrane protein [Burkholderia phage BcepSauron]QBQ74638.1 membrane protein [Burkholderia phage BcepSauron]
MPQFSSDYERRKWQSLQNSAGASLTHIVQGRASMADVQKVTTALNGLNKLAADVFSRAVSAAEVQAKKFEAQYEQVRMDQAIDTLTSFEMALNEALKPLVPELMSNIQEALALELYEATDALQNNLGRKFDHLRELMPPKDLPTVNDVLAANELLVEEIGRVDDDKWGRREPVLIDKIADVFRGTLRDLADQINRERAAQRQAQGGSRHLSLEGPKGHATVEVPMVEESPIMSRVSGLLGAPSGATAASGPVGASGSHQTASTSIASGALAAANGQRTSITLSHSAENAIENAANHQTELYKRLFDFLSGRKGSQGSGDHDGVQGALDEEEKADIWWRSFRNWMGRDLGKSRKKSEKDDGPFKWLKWLKGLGPVLLSMVTNPELYRAMGELIEKYVTWDNVKTAFSAAWDFVAKEASDTIDWVMDKLHLKEVGEWLAKQGKGMAEKVGKFFGINENTGKIGNDMSGGGGENPDFDKSRTGDPYKNGGPPGAAAGVSMPVPVGKDGQPLPNARSEKGDTYVSKLMQSIGLNAGDSSTYQQALINNRSTLVTPAGLTGMRGTYSVPQNPAMMKPGVSIDPNAVGVIAESSEFTLPGAAKGTTQVGIDTFGFQAASSDSLLMMNTHFFTS